MQVGRFEGLPDIPANWLELLQAETVVLQRTMPVSSQEAQAKAAQDYLAELKELEEKCPQTSAFIRISNEAVHASLVESGVNEETASRLTRRFTFSVLALLRMLTLSLRAQES